ncbi:type VI secretion system protein TssA [Paralcaligenes ginsengisoli]
MPINSSERTLGLDPVGPQRPAGENPREGEKFSEVQAQIDRLTDIHTDGAVNWDKVASLTSQILREEGKDLSAAIWLLAAWMHLYGSIGLAGGVHVLNDLVHTYWEEMSPPPARLRGRRNQMQWLLDHMGEYLQGELEALPDKVHAELLADWEALDAAWQSHDTEAPAFYGLRRALSAVPIENTATGTAAPEPSPSSKSVEPANGPAGAPSNTNSPAAPSPALLPTSVPASGADPETVIDSALTNLRPLIEWCLNDHITLPLLFRLNRICAWASLDAAPPNTGGTTRIPPPPDQMTTGLAQVEQGTEAQAVVHFVEARLINQRYWLDLNRAAHAALSRMGASEAAATVAFETTQLIARLPELATLSFSDGRPFADAATRIWLNTLANTRPAQNGADSDALHGLTEKADADAAAGKLEAALDSLQSAIDQTNSTRDAFRLRVAQCDLLHRFDSRADLRPLLAPLIDVLDVYQLSRWEPDLARQTLELAAAVERRYGAEPSQPPAPMLTRLAGLDCHAAWRLSQAPTS